MASKKRKVSFYRLSLGKKEIPPGATKVKQLNNDEIETWFKLIYSDHMQELSDRHKAININSSSGKYVIEVVSYEDHRAFLKIGQQNPSNTVALRDRSTLETEAVPMNSNQLLELYTFCLIDFVTGIVSYIGINGAPRISAVRNMFDQILYKEHSIVAQLAVILTNDILDVLIHKHIISKVSITVAIPEDQILSDIGVDLENFDAIRNLHTQTAQYSLVGKRNRNIFSASDKLAELIASIKMKFGDQLKGLSANAKDQDEKSQTYDLLQYSFTKTVVLGQEDEELLQLDDFMNALVSTYDQYKDELLKYCRS